MVKGLTIHDSSRFQFMVSCLGLVVFRFWISRFRDFNISRFPNFRFYGFSNLSVYGFPDFNTHEVLVLFVYIHVMIALFDAIVLCCQCLCKGVHHMRECKPLGHIHLSLSSKP